MRRRVLVWSLVAAGGLLVVTALPFVVTLLQPDRVRHLLAAELSSRFGVDVTIASVSVDLFPNPRIAGSDLVVRLRNRPTLPPFATADGFTITVGLLPVLRRHVQSVELFGLCVNVPPSGRSSGSGAGSEITAVLIDQIRVQNGVLTFVPADSARSPLVFAIHTLEIDNVGAGRAMPFHATLRNPIPTGEAEIRGVLGPWRADNPTETPLAGSYTLSDANLASVNGLEGSVTSRATVDGRLSAIAIRGEAQASGFGLGLGGRPVPVTTTFDAVVDATNGTTRLSRVEGRIVETPFSAAGAVNYLATGEGYAVDFAVDVPGGRIDDLLNLVIASPEPLLVGDVSLTSSFSLPPGPTPVADRLRLDGRFGLGAKRFSEEALHNRFQELSRRSRGLRKSDASEVVMTNITGRFSLQKGVATVPDVAFTVPGASMTLAGTYTLATGLLDLKGTMRMQARLSQTFGGVRSFFLKPFDFLFSGRDAGTVLRVRIAGPREAPRLNVGL